MPDLDFSTGVNLVGLQRDLTRARTLVRDFSRGTNVINVSINLRYTGPSSIQLNAITAAINALRGAAGAPINLGLAGFAGLAAGTAGIGGLVNGVYELAKASDQARIGQIGFERQVARNGYSFTEAADAVGKLQSSLKISKTVAQETISTMLKSGASINQATLFAQAGAASAVAAGKSAQQGVAAVADSLASGLSATLNTIGVSQNLSTYMDQLARSLGKPVSALNDIEKSQAMENLLRAAVINTGEFELLDVAMGGVVGKTGELGSNWQALRETLGAPLVAGVVETLDRAAGVILTVSKTSPATTKAIAQMTLAVAGVAMAWNVSAVAAGIATAATAAYTRALAAASALSLANPWFLVAAAAGLALAAASAYYTKVSEEETARIQKSADDRNKTIGAARDGTAGTEFDDAAARVANRVFTLQGLANDAKKALEELYGPSSTPPDQEAIRKAEADFRKYNGALKVATASMKSLQDVAADKEALTEWNQQLDGAKVKVEKDGLDALGKKLSEIKTNYDQLRASADKTFKTDAGRKNARAQVDALQDQAVLQARADLGEKAAKAVADAERQAEKDRVQGLEDGLGKRRAVREQEVADVRRNADALKTEYASFPAEVIRLEESAQGRIKQIRDQGAKADREYIAGIVGTIQADAAKALAGLQSGVAGIKAEAQLALQGVNKREADDLGKVGGDRGAAQKISAAAAQLRTAIQGEQQKDIAEQRKQDADKAKEAAKKMADEVKATRDRLAAIRQAELQGYKESAAARVSLLERDQAQELRMAGESEAAKLQVVQRGSKSLLAARLQEINAGYAAEQEARRKALQDALSAPEVTKGERSSLTKQYKSDLGALAEKYRSDVNGATQESINTLDDAEKRASDQFQAIQDARSSLAIARAKVSIDDAKTATSGAAARQRLIEALKRELELREGIAARAATGTDEQAAIKAAGDVDTARKALQDAQRAATTEPLRIAGEELGLAKAHHELALDDARTAAQQVSARQVLLADLRKELSLRIASAAEAKKNGNRSEQISADQQVIAARRAVNQAEKQDRDERLNSALSELGLIKARNELTQAEARSTADAARARQLLLGDLRAELALRTAALGQAQQTGTRAEVVDAEGKVIAARRALLDAEAKDRAEALRVPQEELSLVQARAQLAVDEATTNAGAARARQQVIAGLREELSLRVAAAQEAAKVGTRSDVISAEKAVIEARRAVLEAETKSRQESVKLASDEAERYRQIAEFNRGMVVNAQLREELEGRIRASLAAEAEQYLAQAKNAASEQERNGYLDKASALQQAITKSVEDSRRARLGELDTLRDQQAAILTAALNEARTASQREAARRDLVSSAQEQVNLLKQQEALFRQQGRSTVEIGKVTVDRREAETKISELVKAQIEDRQKLVDAGKKLTDQAKELRDAWADASAINGFQRQARALKGAQDAFTELEASTKDYRKTLTSTTGSVGIAEDAIDSTGQTIDRQVKAIKGAQQALASLKTEWDAQKGAVDSLNSSLSTFATASKNQSALDAIARRAQEQYTQSLQAAQEARAKYGAGSPEYAQAVELSARAFQTASGAIKTAADNQASSVEESAKKQQKAYQRQADALGDVPEVMRKTQEAQQAAYQRQADKIKQNAEDLSQTLAQKGLGLDLASAIGAAEDRSTGLKKQVQSAADALKGLLGSTPDALIIKVDPTMQQQFKAAAEVFGDTAGARIISQLSQERLRLERAAPVTAAAPTVTTNNTIIIDGKTVAGSPGVKAAVSTLLDCADRKGLKTAAKKG